MNTRYIITLCLFIPIFCCAQKDRLRFSGTIENRNSDTIMLFSNAKVVKIILVDKNGYFSDTVAVEAGLYAMSDNVEMTTVFLKSGLDIRVKFDAKQFDETIHYDGVGGPENSFLAKNILADEQFAKKHEMLQSEAEFANFLNEKKDKQIQELTNGNYDPDFVRIDQELILQTVEGAKAMFRKELAIKKLKNAISPGFNYENSEGGTSKLSDFKGKFVFIDVWATWCAPCIAEIPHLKAAENRYKGKNIVFLSLSVDYQKNHDKWKKFVADKNLSSVQVLADKAWQSQFIMDYAITSIPRFILIDPEGKVLNADAPRPSSPEFTKEMDTLLN